MLSKAFRVDSLLDGRWRSSRPLGRRAPMIGALICSVVLLPATLRGAEEPPDAASTAETRPPAAAAPIAPELAELVAKIQHQEQRLQNYSAALQTWRRYELPDKGERGGEMQLETRDFRQTVRGDLFNFVDEGQVRNAPGESIGRRISVYDGAKTVSIDEGKSVTIHSGRFEPPQLLPPHCWGVFFLDVNFPLSTYLSGSEAVRANPKVGRYPVEHGFDWEFPKVEAKVLGEEAVDGLACVLVQVKRWKSTSKDPLLQYLWLATERNYHVAQSRSAWLNHGVENVYLVSWVGKWKQCDGGLWFPQEVNVVQHPLAPRPNRPAVAISDAKAPPDRPQADSGLKVQEVTINPNLPADYFALPKIPGQLPTFEIGADGRLIGSPGHPTPAAADPVVTLKSILARLESEEAKYDRLETFARQWRTDLNIEPTFAQRVASAGEMRRHSVIAGARLFYEERVGWDAPDRRAVKKIERQMFDGEVARHYRRNDMYEQHVTSLGLRGPDDMPLLCPHTVTLAAGLDKQSQSLSALLRSSSYSVVTPGKYVNSEPTVTKYPLIVEYVGQERVAGLDCHKLRLDSAFEGPAAPNTFVYLWLARERNLLPVRQEVHSPAWHALLPEGLAYTEDLSEIRPGLWFPLQTHAMAFEKTGRISLAQGSLTLRWQNDVVVDRVIVDPEFDKDLFTTPLTDDLFERERAKVGPTKAENRR